MCPKERIREKIRNIFLENGQDWPLFKREEEDGNAYSVT
jgi:hypothetical protein